jgi:hypothetical protein
VSPKRKRGVWIAPRRNPSTKSPDISVQSILIDTMPSPRFQLLVEHGFDITRDVVTGLCDLVDSQPFIGPLAMVVKKGIVMCDSFRSNEKIAAQFKDRLLDIACYVDVASQKKANDLHLVKRAVNDLVLILNEANSYFEVFTKRGFIVAIMCGNKPILKLNEYDAAITKKLNDLVISLNLSQMNLSLQIYDVVCNIEEWMQNRGGLEAVEGNRGLMDELAQMIGKVNLKYFDCS